MRFICLAQQPHADQRPASKLIDAFNAAPFEGAMRSPAHQHDASHPSSMHQYAIPAAKPRK
jgi:hypothetical protein